MSIREPETTSVATPAALALHNNFKTSMAALKRDLVRTIHYLNAISEKNIHRLLGFKSIYDYAENVAGFNESQARAFLTIGRRLHDLPELKNALAVGLISWTKAETIANKATPENESELIGMAQLLTNRELETKTKTPVSKAIKPIPAPQERKPVALQPKCHVTFSFTPEQYSRWENLMTAQDQGKSKEELLLLGLVGKPVQKKSTGPEHLLIFQECPTCQKATLTNSRGIFRVEKPLLEAARCEATVQQRNGTRRQTIPPRIRRQVMARDHYRCQNPGCTHTLYLQIHHRVPAAQGGQTNLSNLVTLCSKCHRRLHSEELELQRNNQDPVL